MRDEGRKPFEPSPGQDEAMPDTRVDSTLGEGWAVVRLSSPKGLNMLGTMTLRALREELELVLSGDCRCVGILGEGRSFAVGADLREVARLTPESARVFSNLANDTFRLLENAEAAIVAGIDGFCLGGGLDLSLAADWRMASPSSVFGHPGADLGIITGFGGTQRLARLVGQRRSYMWISTASRVGAREAYDAGFLQELCPSDDFRAAFEKRVRTFADLSPEWLRAVKGWFRRHADGWQRSCVVQDFWGSPGTDQSLDLPGRE